MILVAELFKDSECPGMPWAVRVYDEAARMVLFCRARNGSLGGLMVGRFVDLAYPEQAVHVCWSRAGLDAPQPPQSRRSGLVQ